MSYVAAGARETHRGAEECIRPYINEYVMLPVRNPGQENPLMRLLRSTGKEPADASQKRSVPNAERDEPLHLTGGGDLG